MAETMLTAVREEVISKFNCLLGEFLRKLIGAFPADAVQFKAMYNKALFAIAAQQDVLIGPFADFCALHGPQLQAKDDSVLLDNKMPGFEAVDMRAHWESAPQATRDAVWSYVHTLQRLASAHGGESQFLQALESSQDAVSRALRRRHGRLSPEDDLSDVANEVASELGVDLSGIKDVNVDELEKQFDNVQLPAELGGCKLDAAKLKEFAFRQLRNLQKK